MTRSRPRLVLLVLAIVVAVASCGVEAGVTAGAGAGGTGGGEEAAPERDEPTGEDPADDETSDTSGDEAADGGTADDETSDDETSDDEAADDETPDEETPDEETPDEETSDDGTADRPAPGSGPQGYGDDAGFDRLQDDCVAGDERACDLLYLTSPEDSAYEAIGEICGGRVPSADRYCAPETVLADDGFSAPDNPGLATLSRDCVAGDLTACDLLYQISPVGSDEEQTGDTCGGKVPGGAYPTCREHFEGRSV